MQLTMYHASTSAVWADALFVSVLQGSDKPDAGQVRKAIAEAVRAYGGGGCAQRVAQEFGDHPETAIARMRWARAMADQAFAAPPAQGPKTAGTTRSRPSDTATGQDMKRIRISRPRTRRERPWADDLPADPRDPDIVRAKAQAAHKQTGSSRSRSTQPKGVP